MVDIQVSAHSMNFIHTTISFPSATTDFQCTFVCGPPIFQERRNFWGIIKSFQTNRDTPWCCIGDFNELLSAAEKEGLMPPQFNRIDLFRDFLNDTGLMDLDFERM